MPQLRMLHWKAGEAFDHSEDVIMDPKWREKYPEIYGEQPDSGSPFPINARTILPEEIVLEMAKKGTYIFGFSDGHLGCYYHEKERIPSTVEILTPLEALLKCGGESVFEAADSGASVPCGMIDKHIPED